MKIYSSIIALILLGALVQGASYSKYVNKADAQAVCLDGQPAFLYFQDGAPSPTEGLIILFQSLANYCGDSTLSLSLERCLLVQQQVKALNNTIDVRFGILRDERFANWAKVIVPHCDGGLYQGYAKSAVKYKSTEFYFRGNKVIRSNLDYVSKRFNISKFSHVVMAGSGFGAIGAMTWARQFRDDYVLKNGSAKFSLIVDSIPQFYPSFVTGKNQYEITLRNLMKVANADETHPNLLCALRNEGQQQKCFSFFEAYQYMDFPIMSVDSQYDKISIVYNLQIYNSLQVCSQKEKAFIQKYRTDKLVSLFRFINFKGNSMYSIACRSVYLMEETYDWNKFEVDGVRVSEAVKSFIFGDRTVVRDKYSWPSNTGCSDQS